MKPNSVLYRYIFKELFQPFFLSIVFLTFVFLMTRILDITDMVVNYRVSLWTIARLLFYSMPFFLEFIIPMSVMMATLLTFLRLSGDNEIVALKAGGLSLYTLLPPVLMFCLVGCLMTAFMAIYGLPHGRMASKRLALEAIVDNVNVGLKERTFNDRFDGVMLYVNKIDHEKNELSNIFIEDSRDAGIVTTITAPQGHLRAEKEKFKFHLRLYNGGINQVNPKTKTSHTLTFGAYDIALQLKNPADAIAGAAKDEEEMSIPELRRYIADHASQKDAQYFLTLMELHKKFSIPLACFALGLLAMPLGIQSRFSKRSFGIGLGMLFFILYYMLLSAGWVFGEAGVYPPFIGMWVPNVVMAAIGVALLIFTANEYLIRFDFIFDFARAVFKNARALFKKARARLEKGWRFIQKKGEE